MLQRMLQKYRWETLRWERFGWGTYRLRTVVWTCGLMLLSTLDLAGQSGPAPSSPALNPNAQSTAAQGQAGEPTAQQKAVGQADTKLLAYATADARKALQPVMNDQHPSVLVALGRVFEQEKKYSDAAAKLRQAANLAPADPEPWLQLGRVLAQDKRQADADAAWQKALTLAEAKVQAAGQDKTALLQLGVAQRGCKRYDDALATFQRLRDLQPDHALAVFEQGVTRALKQEWTPAVEVLTRAIELNSGIAYAYYYRGLAASQIRRKDLTVNDLHRFLAMAPNAPEASRAKKIVQSVGG